MLFPNKSKDGILNSLGIFLLGIMAGWTNENTAFSLIVLVLAMVMNFYIKRKLKIWVLAGLIGNIFGFLFLILAPGNMERASIVQRGEDYSFVLYHIKIPLLTTIKIMITQIPIWGVFFIIISILLNHFIKNKMTFKDINNKYGSELSYPFLLIVLSIFNNLLMFASPSPSFPIRASFGSSVFLIIGVLSLFRINIIRNRLNKRNMFFATSISIFLIVSMNFTFCAYLKLNIEDRKRLELIDKNKELGNTEVTVPPYSIKYSNPYESHFGHVFVGDIGVEPNIWPNTIYAQYLDLNSIKIEEK